MFLQPVLDLLDPLVWREMQRPMDIPTQLREVQTQVATVFVHGLHEIRGGVSGNHAGTQGVSRRREGNGRLSAYSRLSSTACLRQVVRRRHTACGLGATRPEPAWHHKATLELDRI